jgi:hypothetical protein
VTESLLLKRKRQRDYLERKKQGVLRSAVPWHGLTSAQSAEAGRAAFKTASWVAHRDGLSLSGFLDLLALHTGWLLQQVARQQGLLLALPPGCADPAAELLQALEAANWRPHYPIYEEASKGLS